MKNVALEGHDSKRRRSRRRAGVRHARNRAGQRPSAERCPFPAGLQYEAGEVSCKFNPGEARD